MFSSPRSAFASEAVFFASEEVLLDDRRIGINDPIFTDAVRRVVDKFDAPVITFGGWREHLGNKIRRRKVAFAQA